MKFSYKVFFSTLIAIALVFSVGSSLLLGSVFQAAMKREERITLEENQMLRFSFVTAAATNKATSQAYGLRDVLPESAVRRIAGTLERSNGHCLRVSDEQGNALYTSRDFQGDHHLFDATEDEWRTWVSFSDSTGSYLQAACTVSVGNKRFYLENQRNVTEVIEDRDYYVRMYQVTALCLMGAAAVIVMLLSLLLTRPMKRLSEVSRRIAGGESQLRCPVTSNDEIGALTEDFNNMADSLEGKIHQLEDAARRQEDFIASFAHELKTPLTSIIGYSDMLQTQIMPPEQRFKAAQYINSEGKRLESLSYKLLELIVYQRQTLNPEPIDAKVWLEDVAAALRMAFAEQQVILELRAEEGTIYGERDLLRSLVMNLCDNARKASSAGDTVILSGERTEKGYRLSVEDHGNGISPEALLRITEPFYMVDKSRSRAQNGAGLGLSLCAAVAELHGSALAFDSTPGRGTVVSVELKEGEA